MSGTAAQSPPDPSCPQPNGTGFIGCPEGSYGYGLLWAGRIRLPEAQAYTERPDLYYSPSAVMFAYYITDITIGALFRIAHANAAG